ncbi:Cullin-domain-containing protein [Pluteus cervinus]|uniref:Cullin-domain-containing protein n=1 Tax=Pluteus cervinus TaxID=181527 RepID=A0ACD3ABW4_9AGAR|nr:Cullin-domain-containing protein [Pluteus cervinus]
MTTASATRQRDTPFELLRKCITILLTKDSPEPLPATYEAIYRACQSVVTISANGEGLYDRLKIELERCLTRLVEELMNSPGQRGASMNVDGENHGSVEWLGQFVQICQWFEDQIVLLRSLLTYLDQVYVVATPGLLSVKDLAYSIFASNTFENWRIVERWQAGVKDWLSWERRVRLDHELRLYIPALVSHLVSHRQYANFEAYYIDITQEFYKADSEQHAETMKADPRDFFRHVRRRIEEEDQRSKDVLLAGSLAPVRVVVEKSLLEGRLDWISTTVGPYMEVNDLDSLSSMYKLFSRVGALKVLCAAFKGYMLTSVKTIVTDEVLDDDMVGRLLQLKASADVAIYGAFYDTKPSGGPSSASLSKAGTTSSTTQVPNKEFIYALSDAFTTGFKARRNKPAEMIAKYLDKAMRKGQGTSSDSAFEKILDDALALYRFTDDKDVFRTFYHRALAKRLLLEKSASDDFEKAMLKKLKENYDPEFGMGEEMFKDLALSKEMMRDYHSKLPWDSFGQSLSVVVLQRSAWPFIARDKTIDLPLDMQDELTRYAGYYKQRHSGHTLSWDHALGTATLKARFKAGTKDLSVSLYQGVVLLLFNEAEELKYDEILEATRLDETELKRTLQSLACGKKRVLKKVPMGREVENGDVFRFNADFDDPHPKVHINSIQAKVSPEESKRTQVSIEGDRKLSLDAAIVRIMKAKKEMTYEKLKAATIDAVKNHFVPQVDVIKKRVDALVENEYLERSKRDKNVFLYVA